MAQTHKQTHTQTDGNGNSMTESAKWADRVKINAYPQPLVYTYTWTLYQSPEMLTWQTSCTRKKVLRKMTLKI